MPKPSASPSNAKRKPGQPWYRNVFNANPTRTPPADIQLGMRRYLTSYTAAPNTNDSRITSTPGGGRVKCMAPQYSAVIAIVRSLVRDVSAEAEFRHRKPPLREL